MRSSLATAGLKLSRSPSARDRAARRRIAALVAFAALAAAGAALGLATAPGGEAGARTGPFSYFPSE